MTISAIVRGKRVAQSREGALNTDLHIYHYMLSDISSTSTFLFKISKGNHAMASTMRD